MAEIEQVDLSKVVDVRPTPHSNDRLILQIVIHHDRWGMAPTSVNAQATTFLKNKKQPYVRWLDDLTAEWQPLEYGWLKPEQVGFVVIENRTMVAQHVNPTEEEKAEHEKKIIELSFDGVNPCQEAPPGMPIIGMICSGARAYIRALAGPVNACLTVYPR